MHKILLWKNVAGGGSTETIEEAWHMDRGTVLRLFHELHGRIGSPPGTPALSWHTVDKDGVRHRHEVAADHIEFVQLFMDGIEITDRELKNG